MRVDDSLRVVMTFPGGAGGGSIAARATCEELVRQGAQVTFLAPREVLDGLTASRGIEAVPFPSGGRWNSRWISKYLESMLKSADRQPAAVISWGLESRLLPRLFGNLRADGVRRPGFYLIAAKPSYKNWRRSGRFHGIRTPFGPPDYLAYRRLANRSDHVFAISRHIACELQDIVGLSLDKVSVIYQSPDAEFFRTSVDSSPNLSRGRRLLFHGSLGKHKGVYDAIRALGLVQAAEPDYRCRLRIAGLGGGREEVWSAAEECGVAADIDLLGELGRDEIADELSKCDIALLPSRIEGFGLAITEAMASGVPVVTYGSGANLETVGACGGGWLAEQGSVTSLASALREAVVDPAEAARRGQAGRSYVQRHFSWEKTASIVLTEVKRSVGLAP